MVLEGVVILPGPGHIGKLQNLLCGSTIDQLKIKSKLELELLASNIKSELELLAKKKFLSELDLELLSVSDFVPSWSFWASMWLLTARAFQLH